MNSIRKIRNSLGYTQEQLAKLLHVSRTTVTMWETGKSEPGFETVRMLSTLFNISSDFIIGAGIFEHWEDVIKYYDSVNSKLDELIPPRLEMPTFCDDKFLTAWLDQTLYENDELQVARWYAFAVKKIEIIPKKNPYSDDLTADVTIEFTEEFRSLIVEHLRNANYSVKVVSYQNGSKQMRENPVPESTQKSLDTWLSMYERTPIREIESERNLVNHSQPDNIKQHLLSIYCELNTEGQEKLLGYASDLAATGNYKKK